MANTYYLRYGLDYNPFIKNSNKIFIETSEVKELNARLDFLLQTKGMGLVTGQPGLGKTSALRNYLDNLNPNNYKVIYISLSSLTVMEFYRYLSESLGNQARYRKTENFTLIQEAISLLVDGKKMTPVIVIDEANILSSQILSDLKIIFNFNMDSKDKAVVILSGLSSINDMLHYRNHDDIRQRIVTKFEMEPLNENDSLNYLQTKLEKAGGSMTIFEEGVIKAVISLAGGVPRMIDKVMNTALLIGDKYNAKLITKEIIQMVEDEIK